MLQNKELEQKLKKGADLFVKNAFPYIKKLAKNDKTKSKNSQIQKL